MCVLAVYWGQDQSLMHERPVNGLCLVIDKLTCTHLEIDLQWPLPLLSTVPKQPKVFYTVITPG